MKEALRTWRHYLYGAPITLTSDHKSLQWLTSQSSEKFSDRLARWQELFSLYEFDKIDYLEGKQNVPADFMSRKDLLLLLQHSAFQGRPDTLLTYSYFDPALTSGEASYSVVHDLTTVELLFMDKGLSLDPDVVVCSLTDVQGSSDLATRLRAGQASDLHLGPILRNRQDPCYDPATDPTRNLYCLENDMLIVRDEDSARIVVPPGALKKELLHLHHDCSGHPGKGRTLWTLQQGYYWPNMHKEILQYCASCALCQASNAASRRPAGFSQPHDIPTAPGHSWSVDFLALPETRKGNNTCCVWTDSLTKYCILCPLRQDPQRPLSSAQTAACFMTDVYPMFGCPTVITSDRGPQFASQVWTDIWQSQAASLSLTTAHTPHSNGNAERQNRIINKILRVTLLGLGNTWDDIIHKVVQFELNNNFISSLGMSPSQVLMGFSPRKPWSPPVISHRLHPQAADFLTFHDSLHQAARDQLRQAQIKIIESLDPKRDPSVTFQVGDQAWLNSTDLTFPGGSHSVLPWQGPFAVLDSSVSTVTLQLPPHWKLRTNVFHVGKVKKHVFRPDSLGPTVLPPVPLLRNGIAYWEIDKIIDHRRTGRVIRSTGHKKLEYRVRWQGYGSAHDTWEAAIALRADGQAGLIDEYHSVTGRPVELFTCVLAGASPV